jgi:catechol 2,3-dioxygenase-like lactoylglutathione lyase family enzyme
MVNSVQVRDVPRARRFYGDTLGLRPGEWFNDDWTEFDLSNATFALDGTGEELGIVPGTSSGAEVADVPCWMCFAADPEGNRFTIHQRKSR